MSVKQNLYVSVFVHKCSIMLNYNIQTVCHLNEQLSLCCFFSINVLSNIALSFSQSVTLMCLKYMKGMFSPNAIWHRYFLIPWQSFYGKRAKSLEKFFLTLEMQFVRFYEVSGNRCANINLCMLSKLRWSF